MRDNTTICKGCTRNVIVKRQEVDQILSKSKINPTVMVTKTIYDQRVNTCTACPSLVYGTTCSHSGCLVEYRAKFSAKTCPNPNGSRW
ncbi:hypothetical protein WQ54_00235 [Bacillus sp. SA1-12]|uniref:DUF6171 family protein n=1 Tax=Bacillus sp. SA1-12 TaxID=1455638 RepID=UPI000625F430|nr:DUF6171 family protein [Bacillus sp. SA1-12]KKI94013.1 hypothetical protein WQ54_00235 [Bacillus sp. SA1-12]